jgi:hypothetical protein
VTTEQHPDSPIAALLNLLGYTADTAWTVSITRYLILFTCRPQHRTQFLYVANRPTLSIHLHLPVVVLVLLINTCDCFMPLFNVNLHCLLLPWLVFTVLFHCRAFSPAQNVVDSAFVPPHTHAETSPGLTCPSRDETSLIVTQRLGLPPLYSHPTIPLSVHYALDLFYHDQKCAPFILCPQRTRRPVLIVCSCTLILLLLCSSGDVEVKPGPVASSSTPIPQVLSFVDFCDPKSRVSCTLT